MKTKQLGILLFAAAVFAVMVFSGAASAAWDGKAIDTSWYTKSASEYTINTEAQLAGLATLVNGGYDMFEGKTIKLGADLDLDNKPWTPIGRKGASSGSFYKENLYFQGIFDGQGHTIHNLFITGEKNLGLFGYARDNVEIKNLNLDGVHISYRAWGGTSRYIGSLVGWCSGTITNCTVYNLNAIDYTKVGTYNSGYEIGGLIGYIHSGTVRDCSVYRASSTAGGVYGKQDIGGLIGEAGDDTVVENCYTNCAVHGTSYIGGLIGRIDLHTNNQKGSVKNCSAEGNVDGAFPYSEEPDVFASEYAGGLIGIVHVDIPVTDCTATGRVLGSENVGGLLGYTIGAVSGCQASGSVAGMQYVGGLIGYDDTGGDSKYTITHSYATGDVTGTEKYAGGLVGYAKCCIDDCSASGDVMGPDAEAVGGLVGYAARSVSNSKASGDVVGKKFVGGLVGDGDSSHDMILTGCQASGNVKGTTYVGGLAGRTNDHIKSCTASGTVTATGDFAGGLVGYADRTGNAKTIEGCSAEGAVTGLNNVGGLIGRSYVNVVSCHANGTVSGKPDTTAGSYIGGLIGQSNGAHSITIEKCYATGDVTAGTDYVGGLVGYADDQVSSCYAAGDVSASGKYTGGLIGYADKTIEKCYATGAVSGNTDVGGLAGHVDKKIINCYATGSVSGTTNVGGVSGTSDDYIAFSVALNKEVKGTSNVGTFSGNFKDGRHTLGCTSWSGMSGGGGDKGTSYDSNRIWDCFPKQMWASIPGFGHLGTDTWQANSGNEFFKLPVLIAVGCDTASEAVHLDPVSVHTVTFETEHGSPVPSQEVPTGGKVTRPTPDPVESEFQFSGWYTEPLCVNLWDFDTDTVLTNMTLYAGWTMKPATTYLVVFDVQGHGTAPSSQYVENGQKASEPTPAPTEEGWTFTGWYQESTCTNKWNFATDTVSKDMFLYAGWTQNTCSVRFDVQGIGTAPDSQFVVSGGYVSKPNDPEDDKNVFEGWYKESACTTAWNFDTDTVTGDITLYANWTPKMKVTFDVQGHGTAPDVQYVKSGEKATNPGDLQEDGYRFKGWYHDQSGTTAWDFDTDTITTDTTIYAGWVETCQVYFNNRGHGNETATQTVDKGCPAVRPGDPVDANYVFNGWYTNADYTETWDFATPITGPTQIVAKWTPKTYTVTFDTQGGTPATWTEDCPYGEHITKPDDPVKSDYSFDGWYTAASGDDRWNFATDVITEDMTLYAHWTQTAQSITVDSHQNSTVDISKHSANAGEDITVTIYPDYGYSCTAVTSSQVPSIPTPVRNGNYWTTNFTMPNENVELSVTVAKMQLQTVTITPPVNGTISAEAPNGTVSTVSVSGYEGDTITLYVLPETNYAVKNNSVNVTYNSNTTAVGMYPFHGYLTGSFDMPAYPVSVEGTFIKTTFTIDVTASDHGKIFTDPQTGSAGESVNITIVPDTGYNLSTFTVNGEDKKSEITWSGKEGVYHCTLAGDITAHAEFTEILTPYTITNASAEHGRVVTNMLNAYAGETVHVDLIGETGYIADTATYTDKDGHAQTLTIYPVEGIYSTEFIMPANDTTVSGTFKPMTVNVTFNLDGAGTVEPDEMTVTYGQPYGTLPTPVRDFNQFKGWYNTSGGLVTADTIVTTPGDHALIANWSGPVSILNTRIEFGTEYEGYDERTLTDRVLNQFDEQVKLCFPASTRFNFTNASTHDVLNGNQILLVKNEIYAFNVTTNAGLSEGYYTENIGLVYGSSGASMGNITVTMSVLPAALIGNAYAAVPEIPAFDTFTASGVNLGGGKLQIIRFASPDNLVQIPTGQDNVTNSTILGTGATITVLNAYNITTPDSKIYGFIPLPDSVIFAVYSAKNLANGGTYQADLILKEVTGNLPSLSGAFNDTIASAVQTEKEVTVIAMVSSVNDDEALSVMNKIITDDGTSVSFKVAKSQIPDTSKLVGYHVDESGIERVACEVTGSEGDYYTIRLTGTGFSTYVLAQSPTPVTPYVSSSSRTSGYTVILPEDEPLPTATPTAAPTTAPTPAVPTVKPTTQPTQSSPAPLFGLIAGLGAAALVLARMRR